MVSITTAITTLPHLFAGYVAFAICLTLSDALPQFEVCDNFFAIGNDLKSRAPHYSTMCGATLGPDLRFRKTGSERM
jgi:hypothetical protein